MDITQATLSDCVAFVPSVGICRVVKVYDGDTITIATRVNNSEQIYKFSVRLRGVNCPEMRSNNSSEKQAAEHVQRELYDHIMHKLVKLSDVCYDKYGRLLANVSLDDVDLSKWLLEKRFAVEYDGHTKDVPSDWLEYLSGDAPTRFSKLIQAMNPSRGSFLIS